MERIVKELNNAQERLEKPDVTFKIDDSPDYLYLVQKWAVRVRHFFVKNMEALQH
jgi:hypothetical protein